MNTGSINQSISVRTMVRAIFVFLGLLLTGLTSLGYAANGQCLTYSSSYLTQPASNNPTGCAVGNYADASNTPTVRQWFCNGTSGGTTDICAATIEYCGNNTYDSSLGEQCDESTGASNCTSCICDSGYTPDLAGNCVVDTPCAPSNWDIGTLVGNGVQLGSGILFSDSEITIEFYTDTNNAITKGRATYADGDITIDVDRDIVGTYNVDNVIIIKADLSEYDTNDEIQFTYGYDANFAHHPIMYTYPDHGLWIRGSETDPWIFIHNTGLMNGTSTIFINDELADEGQVPTDTFEMHLSRDRMQGTVPNGTQPWYTMFDPILDVACGPYCEGTPPAQYSVECTDGPPPTQNAEASVLVSSCSFGTRCDWECASGYYKVGSECVAIPPVCFGDTILHNPGGDSFSGSPKHGIIAMDYDVDGDQDFIIAKGSGNNSLVAYENTGLGWSQEQLPGSTAVDWDIEKIMTDDLNGDGHEDIIVVSAGTLKDYVIWNNGDGTYVYHQFGDATQTLDIAVGHYDPGTSTKELYLMKAGPDDQMYSLMIVGGTVVIDDIYPLYESYIGSLPPGFLYGGVESGDFDRDGKDDVYVSYLGNASHGRVLFGQNNFIVDPNLAGANFSQGQLNNYAAYGSDAVAGIINAGNDLDVISFAPQTVGSSIDMKGGNGAGAFTSAGGSAGIAAQGYGGPLLVDMNNDGTQDLVDVYASGADFLLRVVLFDGIGGTIDTFDINIGYTTVGLGTTEVKMDTANFNGDAYNDIIVTSKFFDTKIILGGICTDVSCDTADGKQYYTASPQAPKDYSGRWEYCTDGSAVTPVYSTGEWTWTCEDAACLARNRSCGDGYISDGEECDGAANCTACSCDAGYIIDGNGGCIEEPEGSCYTEDPATQTCLDASTPREIYYVIDVSQSMDIGFTHQRDDNGWETAIGKSMRPLYINHSPGIESGGVITQGYYMGIIGYNGDSVDVIVPSTNSNSTLEAGFLSLTPGGPTGLGDGLARAYEALNSGFTSNQQTVIIVGNGSANAGSGASAFAQEAIDNATLLKNAGVEIYALGIDMYPQAEELYGELVSDSSKLTIVTENDVELRPLHMDMMEDITGCVHQVEQCPDTCYDFTYDWHRAANGDYIFENIYCEGDGPDFEFRISEPTGGVSEGGSILAMPGASGGTNGPNQYAFSAGGRSFSTFEELLTVSCLVGNSGSLEASESNHYCTKRVGESCGDKFVDPGEQCDDGNKNDNDDCLNDCKTNVCGDGVVNLEGTEECDGHEGCNASCQWITPSCTFAAAGTGIAGLSLELTATYDQTGFTYSAVNYGDGKESPLNGTLYHTYEVPGKYVASYTLVSTTNPSIKETCTAQVTVLEPSCGNGILNTGEQCGEVGLTCGGTSLCNGFTCKCENLCPADEGTPTEFYISPLNYGDGYDDPVATQRLHPYLYAGNYTAEFAVVNKGNPEEKSVCNIDIDVIPRTCGNNVQDAGEECGEPGLTCNPDDICNPYSCQCQNSCEEIVDEVEEECDDGGVCSDNPAQGCNYYDATVCGDAYAICINGACSNNANIICGYVGMTNCADGSTCDAQEGDGCNQFCQQEYCGDGLVDLDGENNIFGDADDEVCDDGPYDVDLAGGNNQGVNTDSCTNRCELPGCGDGTVQTEYGETCDRGSRCDDWNGSTPTNCTLDPYLCPGGIIECQPRNWPDCGSVCNLNSYCGDGNIDDSPSNSQGQVEECDDGDTINTNECDNSCFAATCGDGVFQNPNIAGTAEECEFNGSDWVDAVGTIVDCVAPSSDSDPLGCKLVNTEPAGRCQLNPHLDDSQLIIAAGVMTNLSSSDLCFNSVPVLPDLNYINPDSLPEYLGTIPVADHYALSDTDPINVVVYDESIKTYRWDCQGSDPNLDEECTAWICGDGVVDGWVMLDGSGQAVLDENSGETCDDGNTNSGDGCDEFCQLEEVVSEVDGYSGSCVDNTDPDNGANGRLPVVQDDEYLPIWRELDDSDHVNWTATTCSGPDDTGVLGQNMECEFGIYNKDGRVGEKIGPCYRGIDSRQTIANVSPTNNMTTDVAGFALMEDVLKDYGYRNNAVLYPEEAERRANIMGVAFEDMNLHNGGVYGQYKIKLEKINFEYCGEVRNLNQNFAEGSTPDYTTQMLELNDIFDPEGGSVCDMKFGVTQGYFVQKGTGISEEASQAPTSFTNIDGNDLVTTSSPLDETENNVAEFGGAGKQYLTDGFIAYWEGLAVKFVASVMNDGKTRDIYKVPNQRIYLIEESNPNKPIVLDEGSIATVIDDIDIPYTMIVKGTDVIFKGSVEGNGLYVVENDIIFDANEDGAGCDDTEEIEGIFISNGTFRTGLEGPGGNYNPIRNNNLAKNKRCRGGNMIIKGLLIGAREAGFTEKRRSVLDAWKTSANLFTDESQFTMGPNQLKKLALFEYCYRPLLEHNLSVELCEIAAAAGGGGGITPEDNCTDGIDDGGLSGRTDCADITCSPDPACNNAPPPIGENPADGQCDDGIDNNQDGHKDCSDYGCVNASVCFVPIEDGEAGAECDDNIDNNGDGYKDCADFGCIGDPACTTPPAPENAAQCSDGIDNDDDGFVDCADPSCDGFLSCSFDESGLCFDGIDNDGDGTYDCADTECGSLCALYEGGDRPITCFDTLDNDGDGDTDCGQSGGAPDNDCTAAICGSPPLTAETDGGGDACDNGIDEDMDGFIDCADTDCTGQGICAPETPGGVCTDGLDNDGDGRIDCIDQGCPGCGAAENCTDNIDNNGDYQVDCSDSSCVGEVNCIDFSNRPEECRDNIDNDFDGKVDCTDASNSACPAQQHCIGPTPEPEDTTAKCSDGLDNDFNLLIDCADPTCVSIGAPGCTMPGGGSENTAAYCDDGIDNDGDLLVDDYDPDCDLSGGLECYYSVDNGNGKQAKPFDAGGAVLSWIPGIGLCESDPVAVQSWVQGIQPAPSKYPNINHPDYPGKLIEFNAMLGNIKNVFIDEGGTSNRFIFKITSPYNPLVQTILNMNTPIQTSTQHSTWLDSAMHAPVPVDNGLIQERTDEIVQGASFVVEIDPSIWTLNPPGADEFLQDMQVFK